MTTALSTIAPAAAPPAGLFRRLRDAFRAPVVQASADAAGDGGWLVPAGATWSQILDYASGSGDAWPLDFYQAGLPLSRDLAVSYATLSRCVTLISGSVAQLVAGGTLRVVDSDGRRVKTRRAQRVLDILGSSPDGGVTPAQQFIEDAVADYCLDGNALLVPDFSSDGMLARIRRMSPWNSDLEYSNRGEGVYRMLPVDGPSYVEYHAARDVIHVRWPRLLRYGRSTSSREGFAQAPVRALRPALDIGIQGDRYIREWFGRGSRSKMHFNLGRNAGEQAHTVPQLREIKEWVLAQSQTGRPIVTEDMTSASLDDTPQDAEALKLREFEVQEVGRYYGVPAPLLGMNVTQWGQGIEQLAKLFYRFGLRDHTARFLAPVGTRLLAPGNRLVADPTAFLAGDYDAMSKYVMALQGDAQRPPVATREELRHITGLPRDPDGEFMQVEAPSPEPVGEGIIDPDPVQPEQ